MGGSEGADSGECVAVNMSADIVLMETREAE